MFGHYILNDDHSVTAVDLMTWAKWFEEGNRRIAETRLSNGVWISTVFLGSDHGFGREGPPILFETMAFEKDDMGGVYTERYATWDEAVAGHRAAVTEMMERYPNAGVLHEGEPSALVRRKRKINI